jgi:hypothetical protein
MMTDEKELVVTDEERESFCDAAEASADSAMESWIGEHVVADYAIRQIHAARQEKPVIDWGNDESVVRAALPDATAQYVNPEPPTLPGKDGWYILSFHAGTLNLGPLSGYQASPPASWKLARTHPTVKDFERMHNPSMHPRVPKEWHQANANNTDAICGQASLDDAITNGMYHVTCPKCLAMKAQPDPHTSDDWTRAFREHGVNEVVSRIEYKVSTTSASGFTHTYYAQDFPQAVELAVRVKKSWVTELVKITRRVVTEETLIWKGEK